MNRAKTPILSITMALLGALLSSPATAETVKIVGLGASTCARFNQEIGENPKLQRDYFAWTQGFMSGALIPSSSGRGRRP